MKRLKSSYLEWFLAIVPLILYYVMAVTAVSRKSPTYDEPTHLSSGYVIWRYRDFRFQPENGNLPQRLGALPAYLRRDIQAPDVQHDAWAKADQYLLARAFFYGLGNDAVWVQQSGRMVIAGVAALLGFVIFMWGRALYGRWGGLIPLVLFVFSPTFLAHGALTTSDLVVTFFFTASVGAFWWMLHRFHLWSVGASCLALGGLCISKMSCPLILPMLGGMLVARLIDTRPLVVSWFGNRGETKINSAVRKAAVLLGGIILAGIVAYGTIWSAYDFRYSAYSPEVPVPGKFSKPWEEVLAQEGKMGKLCDLLEFAREKHLFPETYIFGFAYVLEQSRSRLCFINGKYGKYGWWYYFPYCLLVKTPIPVLLLVVLGLGGLFWRALSPGGGRAGDTELGSSGISVSDGRDSVSHSLIQKLQGYRCALTRSRFWSVLYPTVPLWCLLAVYWAVSLRSHLNIGHRHILPTYPAMFLLVGGILSLPLPRRVLTVITGTLLFWHVAASLSIRPHYLAYFNAFAGGPENGYRHLVDSSLDWGQDLITLRDWLAANRRNGEPVYLSYQGTGEPEYYGLDVNRLPCFGISWNQNSLDFSFELQAGIYCISATRLALMFNPFGPVWKAEWEPEYVELAREMDHLRLSSSGTVLPSTMSADLQKRINRYRQMRLAKLCTVLRKWEPDASVGYSILIYRLDEEDLKRIVPEL